MAEAECVFHNDTAFLVETPWLSSVERVIIRVQAENRRIATKLHPSGCKFIILVAVSMATDVVTPPPISNVGSCGCELRLEVQRLPSNDSIARETNLVTLCAWTAET